MWYKHINPPTFVAFFAALAGLILFNRLSAIAKIALVLLFLNVITDVYATYLAEHDVNNHICYSILTTVEHVLIILSYSAIYRNNNIKFIFYGLSLLIFVCSVLNLLFIQGADSFNTFTFVPIGLIVSILSYLRIRSSILNEDKFQYQFSFWFAAANFQYFIIVAPILSAVLAANEMSYSLSISFKQVNNTAYIIWSVLISIGFICQEKKTI
jgi:hypothetical protein